ncbi:MAG: GNAT family N-acetyltransferase [Candidatus Dormibacteria bacterium]
MGRPGPVATERDRPRVTLRGARWDDASMVRAWRNDADAVRFSVSARPVAAGEHARWFARAVTDPQIRLWIAEENGIPVGQVRVDLDGESGVVSIAVAASARGRGVGQQMLRLALEEIQRQHIVTTMTAVTHPDNQASIHAFERVGFRRRDMSEEGLVVLELTLDS